MELIERARWSSETTWASGARGAPRFVLPCACRSEFVISSGKRNDDKKSSLHGHEFERMGFTSEIRTPTTWYTKLAISALALAIFAFLAATAISGYSVYRMITPPHSHSDIDLQHFPGHPVQLNITVNGGQRDGWFFPGLKTAPTIILCPAYESSRGELLTLASALQDQQYNVLVFDFSGQGSSTGKSTLGFREVSELRAAVDAVAHRGDVDVNRFGLWGVNLGAYTALAEASADSRVRAIAVESPYARPADMVAVQIKRAGLGSLPLVTRLAQTIFGWLNSQFRNVPPLNVRIAKLSGVPQLYMESPDEPLLAASTAELFRVSPPPHEFAVLPHGNYAGMLDEEKRNYENRIVSFFVLNLPLSGPVLPEIK
jgi:pimeloyl-ACP methyl ester carboxylesterase